MKIVFGSFRLRIGFRYHCLLAIAHSMHNILLVTIIMSQNELRPRPRFFMLKLRCVSHYLCHRESHTFS